MTLSPDTECGGQVRNKQIYRVIGKVITIAANAYRHRIGKPYNEPVSHTHNKCHPHTHVASVHCSLTLRWSCRVPSHAKQL